MKHPIKVMIKKCRPFGYNWIRYEEVDRILLDNNGPIKTEAQFAYYIYRKFGTGRYQCLAWQKGYEGFWLFWLGDIYDNGFFRDIRKNKEIERLKDDWKKASSYEEKEEIETDIQFYKEILGEEKKHKRSGPIGLKTSRPGQLHPYEEF